ncbi:MAG: nitroreductase family deazaflavin-dependent oxidoreductase [Dehalococcoidia bacterium]
MNDRNRAVIDEFRANGGRVTLHPATDGLVLLTTTGAKSGRQHTTPLAYHRDGDRIIVVASKGGAPENPAWFHNLRANPTVTVEVGSEKFEAHASVAEGEERDRLYRQQAAQFDTFNDYEKRTTRRIPVVILTRA